jgi:site-specific recombinase XerC
MRPFTASLIEPLPHGPQNIHRSSGMRSSALTGVLLGCGLRRRELTDLEFTHLQQREEHWAIVDLIGKCGHIPNRSYA